MAIKTTAQEKEIYDVKEKGRIEAKVEDAKLKKEATSEEEYKNARQALKNKYFSKKRIMWYLNDKNNCLPEIGAIVSSTTVIAGLATNNPLMIIGSLALAVPTLTYTFSRLLGVFEKKAEFYDAKVQELSDQPERVF